MSTFARAGLHRTTSTCVAAVLVVAALSCWAAEPSACDDVASAKLKVHQLGKRLDEVTAVQRRRAEAIKVFVAERGQSRGWSEARQSEVIAQYLESGPYVVLQAKRAPNDLILDRVKSVLRSQPADQQAVLIACEQLQNAMAAVEENFQINERQYELARKYIEEAQ